MTPYRSNAYPQPIDSTSNRAKNSVLVGIFASTFLLAGFYIGVHFTSKTIQQDEYCKENMTLLSKGQAGSCYPGKTMHLQETYEGLVAWCTCPGQKDIDIRNIHGISLPLKEE